MYSYSHTYPKGVGLNIEISSPSHDGLSAVVGAAIVRSSPYMVPLTAGSPPNPFPWPAFVSYWCEGFLGINSEDEWVAASGGYRKWRYARWGRSNDKRHIRLPSSKVFVVFRKGGPTR